MLLKAVAITQMPLVYFTFINNKSEIHGNLLDFPNILQKYANISYQIVSPKLPGWNGMMNELANMEADISLTPIVETERAMSLMNFSSTIFFSSYVILSKSNQFKTKTDLVDHVYKIELTVWLLMLLTVIMTLSVIYFDKYVQAQMEFWHIICIIFLQNHPGKLIYSPTAIIITLFSMCYTLLLIAINTTIGVRIIVVSNNIEINSMEDILRTESVLPAIYKSTSLETLLSTSKDPVHQRLWTLAKSHPDLCLRIVPAHVNGESIGHNRDFYQALLSGRVATFEPDYYSDLIICDYCLQIPSMRWHRSPPIHSLPLRFAFGIRKGLDHNLVRIINQLIQKLRGAGLFSKWFQDDYALAKIFNQKPPPPECSKNFGDNDSEYIPINMSNMKYFSRVVSVMFLMSYTLLWIEILSYEYAFRQKKISPC